MGRWKGGSALFGFHKGKFPTPGSGEGSWYSPAANEPWWHCLVLSASVCFSQCYSAVGENTECKGLEKPEMETVQHLVLF